MGFPVKHSGGRVISAPNFGSQHPRFESHWRQNSSHDYTALDCAEPFFITLPLSRYDLNNVERDVKNQIIIIMGFPRLLCPLGKLLFEWALKWPFS